MDYLFTVPLGNPKKDLQTILVNMGLLFANYPKSGFWTLNEDFPIERTLNLTFLNKFLLKPLNSCGHTTDFLPR